MDADKPKRGPGRPKGSKNKPKPPRKRAVPPAEEVKRLRRAAQEAEHRRNRRALFLQRHIYALKVMTNELNMSLWSVAHRANPDLSCFYADFRQLLIQVPKWQLRRVTGMRDSKFSRFTLTKKDVKFITVIRVCYGLGLRLRFELMPEYARLSPDPVHALVPDVDSVGLKARNPQINHDLAATMLRMEPSTAKPDPENSIPQRHVLRDRNRPENPEKEGENA